MTTRLAVSHHWKWDYCHYYTHHSHFCAHINITLQVLDKPLLTDFVLGSALQTLNQQKTINRTNQHKTLLSITDAAHCVELEWWTAFFSKIFPNLDFLFCCWWRMPSITLLQNLPWGTDLLLWTYDSHLCHAHQSIQCFPYDLSISARCINHYIYYYIYDI